MMRNKTSYWIVALLLAGALRSQAAEPDRASASPEPADASLDMRQIDPLDRVFPDQPCPTAEVPRLHVPRGGWVPLQFALTARDGDAVAKLEVGPIRRDDGLALPATAVIYEVVPVHVEGNTQGSMCNKPGGDVPAGWQKYLVRRAPFDTGEVLVEHDTAALRVDTTTTVVVDVKVDASAEPGFYTGRLIATTSRGTKAADFGFQVHKAAVPEQYKLHSTHWLDASPENLASGQAPPWWSERHWQRLERAGRQLRRFGDDTMETPLIDGDDPLIPVTQDADGQYHFDYTRFDRWVTMFQRQGFRLFAGRHLNGMGRSVVVRDAATGERRRPFRDDLGQKKWLAFLPTFLRDFCRHLEDRGWSFVYLQHQYDEPRDHALYERFASAVRSCMPGVASIDAINSRFETYSPYVDDLVFNINVIRHPELAAERARRGKSNWLYHCTSPYPPYPNRHLDCPLPDCRVWPWICYAYQMDGFLFWAANRYRGVSDEYRHSLGPAGQLADGQVVTVGHPPGDNWLYYRGPNGLRPSVRILAHREGMLDHALLSMLAQVDPKTADSLAAGVVDGVVAQTRAYPSDWGWKRYREAVNYLKSTYASRPAAYHAARGEILDALDRRLP